MSERRIYRGVHASYHWLTSTEDYGGTLLRLFPEIVVGRYVAVTCIDGGILRLGESQRATGWESRAGIAYSRKIHSAAEITHQVDGPDAPGYDEFYVFEDTCDLGERVQGNIFLEAFAPAAGRTAVFVTWASFVLHDSSPSVKSLVDLFWPQLERLKPESYIADGNQCLTVVTKKPELLDRIHQRFASIPLS